MEKSETLKLLTKTVAQLEENIKSINQRLAYSVQSNAGVVKVERRFETQDCWCKSHDHKGRPRKAKLEWENQIQRLEGVIADEERQIAELKKEKCSTCRNGWAGSIYRPLLTRVLRLRPPLTSPLVAVDKPGPLKMILRGRRAVLIAVVHSYAVTAPEALPLTPVNHLLLSPLLLSSGSSLRSSWVHTAEYEENIKKLLAEFKQKAEELDVRIKYLRDHPEDQH